MNLVQLRRFIALSAVLMLAIVGCGPKVMPRGTGATGLMTSVVNQDRGLSLINKLDPGQQRRFDMMHRPFAAVVQPATQPTAEGQTVLEKVKENWDAIPYARVTEDQRIDYSVILRTTAGPIEVQMFIDQSPDHVRNFLALAKSGFFDGKAISRDVDSFYFGWPPVEAPYYLQPRFFGMSPRRGALLTRSTIEDRSPGTAFSIWLEADSDLGPEVTMFGGISGAQNDKVLNKINEQLQRVPAVVTILGVDIVERSGRLFMTDPGGETTIRLPNASDLKEAESMLIQARNQLIRRGKKAREKATETPPAPGTSVPETKDEPKANQSGDGKSTEPSSSSAKEIQKDVSGNTKSDPKPNNEISNPIEPTDKVEKPAEKKSSPPRTEGDTSKSQKTGQ